MDEDWNWKQAFLAEVSLWLLEFCHQVFGYGSPPPMKTEAVAKLGGHALAGRKGQSVLIWSR